MNEATQKADLLVQAIKYIKQFEHKVVVIKYGGNAMEDPAAKNLVFEDIAMLNRLGMKIVVVHGGGPKIDTELQKQNLPTKRIHGLRVTDTATLEIVKTVFAKINEDCLKQLKNHGAQTVDCTKGALISRIKDNELGFVGEISRVNTSAINQALNKGIIPVLSSLGETEDGQITNINADTAAAEVALALKAEKLTVLTNVDAVLDDNKQRISHLDDKQAEQLIEKGVISTGMIPKVRACIQATENGVKKAHLLNGMIPRALLLEIFTDQGIGTEVVK